AEHPVRVRLRSLAIRIEHEGPPERAQRVVVSYLQPGGGVHRVTARSVVVAAWGMVAKHIVPELPVEQRRALEDYRYCSAIYINVLLRHWRPIAEIGASEMFWPDGYCTWMQISDPLRVGEYHPDYHPDRPTVLSMYKYIYKPGLPPADQMMLGRYELENKPFEEYEREIRSELNHALGPWGFDAAEDILAITVNRWGHGYNFFPPQPGKTPAYELGRTRLGRISFAGADAGGTPWTQAAMEQAHRAAHEQLALS
ncbi:MAG TPA: FAD-dependent oxidoreductase, partial [Vicinamibacteria bacterium]